MELFVTGCVIKERGKRNTTKLSSVIFRKVIEKTNEKRVGLLEVIKGPRVV